MPRTKKTETIEDVIARKEKKGKKAMVLAKALVKKDKALSKVKRVVNKTTKKSTKKVFPSSRTTTGYILVNRKNPVVIDERFPIFWKRKMAVEEMQRMDGGWRVEKCEIIYSEAA